MDFIITVDVEADNQWQRPSTLAVENIKFLPRFQTLCAKYNFPPTYFVTYEVATNQNCVAILKKFQKQGAEIAAHLHPWSTPPFIESSAWELAHHRFPSELPLVELAAKLKVLTEALTKNFGQAPTGFRAGRWGISGVLLKLLSEQHYLVDASITPKISWVKHYDSTDASGGLDFKRAPSHPYYPDYKNILTSGSADILEVPMTILYTGLFKNEKNIFSKNFVSWPESLLKKIVNRILFRQKWLRIFHNSKKSDWQNIYHSALINNLPILQFMIHSSELMPGVSPYAKTEAAVDFIYQQLEEMFKFFVANNLSGKTLTSFAKANKKYASTNQKNN